MDFDFYILEYSFVAFIFFNIIPITAIYRNENMREHALEQIETFRKKFRRTETRVFPVVGSSSKPYSIE